MVLASLVEVALSWIKACQKRSVELNRRYKILEDEVKALATCMCSFEHMLIKYNGKPTLWLKMIGNAVGLYGDILEDTVVTADLHHRAQVKSEVLAADLNMLQTRLNQLKNNITWMMSMKQELQSSLAGNDKLREFDEGTLVEDFDIFYKPQYGIHHKWPTKESASLDAAIRAFEGVHLEGRAFPQALSCFLHKIPDWGVITEIHPAVYQRSIPGVIVCDKLKYWELYFVSWATQEAAGGARDYLHCSVGRFRPMGCCFRYPLGTSEPPTSFLNRLNFYLALLSISQSTQQLVWEITGKTIALSL